MSTRQHFGRKIHTEHTTTLPGQTPSSHTAFRKTPLPRGSSKQSPLKYECAADTWWIVVKGRWAGGEIIKTLTKIDRVIRRNVYSLLKVFNWQTFLRNIIHVRHPPMAGGLLPPVLLVGIQNNNGPPEEMDGGRKWQSRYGSRGGGTLRTSVRDNCRKNENNIFVWIGCNNNKTIKPRFLINGKIYFLKALNLKSGTSKRAVKHLRGRWGLLPSPQKSKKAYYKMMKIK